MAAPSVQHDMNADVKFAFTTSETKTKVAGKVVDKKVEVITSAVPFLKIEDEADKPVQI
jgi:hypothetical protein